MAYVPRKDSRYQPEDYRQRPREYDPALADEILDRVRNGEVLTDICDDRDMPLPGTFLMWVEDDPDLAERYERALRIGADVTFDEIVSVAWDNDTMRGHLRSKVLTQRVEKLMPEKYGPRATIRTGKEPDDAAAGIDYAAEIRRKLRVMSERLQDAGTDQAASG